MIVRTCGTRCAYARSLVTINFYRVPQVAYNPWCFCASRSVAYLDLLIGGGATQIFSLIQAQRLKVKLLIIFKSGESLIFVVSFFFF
jgi:hypothetical protein